MALEKFALDSEAVVAQQPISYHECAIEKIRCLLANNIGLPSAMATTTAKRHQENITEVTSEAGGKVDVKNTTDEIAGVAERNPGWRTASGDH